MTASTVLAFMSLEELKGKPDRTWAIEGLGMKPWAGGEDDGRRQATLIE